MAMKRFKSLQPVIEVENVLKNCPTNFILNYAGNKEQLSIKKLFLNTISIILFSNYPFGAASNVLTPEKTILLVLLGRNLMLTVFWYDLVVL